LVSILINNYNYGRYLRPAIDSALKQTFKEIEVIVVDDGSTDESRDVIRSYGGRVQAILQSNRGQASAINTGWAAARGEWILLLDSDDLFFPKKVETILSYSREYPQAGLIAHNVQYVDAGAQPIDFPATRFDELRFIDHRAMARAGRIHVWLPATSALAVRRDVLAQILPMPEDIRITADDYIKLAALVLTPALVTPQRLAAQRIHGENRYTMSECDASEAARLNEYLVRARNWYYLRQRFPFVSRMAWKYYGRLRFELGSSTSAARRKMWRQIRSKYNVFEPRSPHCWFYVSDAYMRAFARAWWPHKHL
jgi:glycosyltransferase involved in cell wall biosynthesis